MYNNIKEVEITDDMILQDKVYYTNPVKDEDYIITGVFKDNLG